MTGLQKIAQFNWNSGELGPHYSNAFNQKPVAPQQQQPAYARPSFRSAPPSPSPKPAYERPSFRAAGPERSWYQRNVTDLWKNRLAFRDMDAATASDAIPIGVDNPVPWTRDFNYGKHNSFLYDMVVNPGHQSGQSGMGFGPLGGQGKRDQLLGSLGVLTSATGVGPMVGAGNAFKTLFATDVATNLDDRRYRDAAVNAGFLFGPGVGGYLGKKLLGNAFPAVSRYLLRNGPEAVAKAKALGEGVGATSGRRTTLGASIAGASVQRYNEAVAEAKAQMANMPTPEEVRRAGLDEGTRQFMSDYVKKYTSPDLNSSSEGVSGLLRNPVPKIPNEAMGMNQNQFDEYINEKSKEELKALLPGLDKQLRAGGEKIHEKAGPFIDKHKYTVAPMTLKERGDAKLPLALGEGARYNWDNKIMPWMKDNKTAIGLGAAGAGGLGLMAYMLARRRRRKALEEQNQ